MRSGNAVVRLCQIYDITDETQPKLASKLMLEVHDPENCLDVINDNVDAIPRNFGYDTHQCTVDDERETSLLICSQFGSGIRVYDIRDPYRPREIAYYNPPATGCSGMSDMTGSMPAFRKETGEIWFVSNCNGFQVVKLDDRVWPLPLFNSCYSRIQSQNT